MTANNLKLEYRDPKTLSPKEKKMEWRDVVGFEGFYQINAIGGIRRVKLGRGSVIGRILKNTNHPNGYLSVSLWRDNVGFTFLVHRLVVDAFIGTIPKDKEVNHKDGNKKNNHVSNLEIVTRKENIAHAMNTQIINNKGEDNVMARLTEENVSLIRQLYTKGGIRNGGPGYISLGKQFDVHWGTIRNIIKGNTWGWTLTKS
jgi:hypothetical protein